MAELEARTDAAAKAVRTGDLRGAEQVLLEISDRLDAFEPDPELREFPRGLVDYDAGADRGVPTPEEEDSVRNRLLLAERLAAVAASEGVEVSPARARLRQAQAALDEGDRPRAVALGDAALDEIDRLRRRRTGRGPS